MQPVPAPRPGRRLAARDVLPRHPPARDFSRPGRILQVVDDENVADVAFHLGRDVGVTLVHIEAVHARCRRSSDRQISFGFCWHGDVVDLETAVVVTAPLELFELAQVVLGDAQLCSNLASQSGSRRSCSRNARLCSRQLLGAPAQLAHIALVIDHHHAAGQREPCGCAIPDRRYVTVAVTRGLRGSEMSRTEVPS